ncbi:intradiol ring-cleavage dioxygenase [Oryzobacter telluris]|uniref:intradiol ring-cleavage dioxygenase n=1 Tax=Oryzobacter telluris TaxID=3149179 RepID=UPI00370D355F
MSTSTPPQPTDRPEPGVHPDHDRGLEFDVRTLLARRSALGLISGAGLLALVGCATDTTSGSTASTTASTTSSATAGASSSATATAAAGAVDTEVPDETGGPYPGDGSNGPNVLDDSGIVRQDITSSFGTSTTTAAGVPLTVNLTVTDGANGYAAMEGVAVYAWHADAQGRYSMYSQGVENENYLRGVQPTNAEGTATFTTVFPGCYDGRWPHIHFEVYKSTAEATSTGQIVKTSQIALPQAACEKVYADTATYPQSASNLGRTSLTGDMVFGDDGGIHQLATVTGDATSGYVANLTIGV